MVVWVLQVVWVLWWWCMLHSCTNSGKYTMINVHYCIDVCSTYTVHNLKPSTPWWWRIRVYTALSVCNQMLRDVHTVELWWNTQACEPSLMCDSSKLMESEQSKFDDGTVMKLRVLEVWWPTDPSLILRLAHIGSSPKVDGCWTIWFRDLLQTHTASKCKSWHSLIKIGVN